MKSALRLLKFQPQHERHMAQAAARMSPQHAALLAQVRRIYENIQALVMSWPETIGPLLEVTDSLVQRLHASGSISPTSQHPPGDPS